MKLYRSKRALGVEISKLLERHLDQLLISDVCPKTAGNSWPDNLINENKSVVATLPSTCEPVFYYTCLLLDIKFIPRVGFFESVMIAFSRNISPQGTQCDPIAMIKLPDVR